jgi:ACS family hexuronate transporter-like MFS transporter
VQKSIPITNQRYSQLQFMFLLAYGIMYAGGGKVVDVLGTRFGYAVMIIWWSAASFVQGLVSTVFGIGVALFCLGLGEGGGFPASAKAVSEWFPPKERSLAFGIFNTGSSLGAVIAPPAIAAIVLWASWRWVFFIAGTLGLAWVLLWLVVYERPSAHRLVTAAERDYIRFSLPAQVGAAGRVSWIGLFRYRQVWGLVAAKFLSDAAWFFFIFWLPRYLGDVRGLNIKEIGYYAWIPYACAGLGSATGGWLSSYLMRRGFSVDRSRKTAMGIGAACLPASLLITASPINLAIVFFSMALFGHQFFSTVVQTLAADMFPSKIVGSVAGVLGAAGAFGAMLFNLLVGTLLTSHHRYILVFAIAGLLHPTSFAIILLVVRKIRPVLDISSGTGYASPQPAGQVLS